MRLTLLAAAILTSLAASTNAAENAPAPPPAITAVHCAHLLDVDSGKMLGETTIVIEGKRIKEIKSGSEKIPGATSEYSFAPTSTCLPGLIDSHVHLTMQFSPTTYSDQFRLNAADYAIRSTVYAKRTLDAGFTTVRNLADQNNDSVALRNAINSGLIPGPRIFTAGVAVGSTGGHADATDGYRQDFAGDPGPKQGIINSPEDAWKAVRQHYKDGADLIKIMPSGGVLDESSSVDNAQLTIPEIQAVVAAAHDYGFTVAAHAHGAEAIRRAVIGGVDSIEHGTYVNDEDMKLMKEHGTWYVPTIIAGKTAEAQAKIPGNYPPQVAAKALQVGPLIQASAGRAYKAGVKIAFGTDAGVFPHGKNAQEFKYMVDAGMPPLFVIQAATTHAAELLKKSKDIGSIAPGKFADVIAIDGNPLDDVTLLQNVRFVMKEGVVYKGNLAPTPLAQIQDLPVFTAPAELQGF